MNEQFHIHWNGRNDLDWECFDTHGAAEERALFLRHEGETFQIKQVSAECPLRRKAAFADGK